MQLLLQKEIFPKNTLHPEVFQKMPVLGPRDAQAAMRFQDRVWPCHPAGLLHLPQYVGTLWHTMIPSTAPFALHLSVVPADLAQLRRFCVLWNCRSHPTLGKVSLAVAASDETAAAAPLCCMQRFSALPDTSPITLTVHLGLKLYNFFISSRNDLVAI